MQYLAEQLVSWCRARKVSVGFYCLLHSSHFQSGLPSLWERPEDPSSGRHLGPIFSFLAMVQNVLDSPTHGCLQLLASESAGSRMENAGRHYTSTEEDGRSRHSLPWVLLDIRSVLVPQFVNESLQMNGLICPQTVGGGICLSEHRSRRDSAHQDIAWMRPEHYLSQVDVLNAHFPSWEEIDLIFFKVSLIFFFFPVKGRGALHVHTSPFTVFFFFFLRRLVIKKLKYLESRTSEHKLKQISVINGWLDSELYIHLISAGEQQHHQPWVK